MNKEEIEDIKDNLRTLHKVLWNEHKEGTYTIQRILEYINCLEQKETILDKVTDKLKEVDKKYKNEYENIENMELSATKICVLQELTCVIEDIEEILNIIEGEKK